MHIYSLTSLGTSLRHHLLIMAKIKCLGNSVLALGHLVGVELTPSERTQREFVLQGAESFCLHLDLTSQDMHEVMNGNFLS